GAPGLNPAGPCVRPSPSADSLNPALRPRSETELSRPPEEEAFGRSQISLRRNRDRAGGPGARRCDPAEPEPLASAPDQRGHARRPSRPDRGGADPLLLRVSAG